MAFNNSINAQQRLSPTDGPQFNTINLSGRFMAFGPTSIGNINLQAPATAGAATRVYQINDILDDGNMVLSTVMQKLEFYLNQNKQANPIVWYGAATTTGGVATFFPTDTNTAGGNALFTTITIAAPFAGANTGSAVASPQASLKLVSADRKTITVNVVTGTTLLALGPTQVFAPNGTAVGLIVIGT